MILTGVGISAYPFFKSMSVNAKAENSAWATCDLIKLREGRTMRCGLLEQNLYVHKVKWKSTARVLVRLN